MEPRLQREGRTWLCLSLLVLSMWLPAPPAKAGGPQVWAIEGARVVPVSGAPIERGTVVVRDGIIESVGAGIPVPPDARVLDGTGLTVYPGLIDAFSFVEEPQQNDQDRNQQQGRRRRVEAPDRERPLGVSPEREAIELVQTSGQDKLREVGVTTFLAVPKGGIFRGTSVLVATAGDTPQAMSLRMPVAQHLSFESQGGFGQYPTSLMGVISVVRQKLLDARHYRQEWERYDESPRNMRRPEPSDELAALVQVLGKKVPVVVEANSTAQIRRTLGLAREFDLDVILAGGAESWRMTEEIKRANVPVLLSLAFPEPDRNDDPESREPLRVLEAREEAPRTAAKLHSAGIKFAFQSNGTKRPKEFLDNAIKCVEGGLSKDAALRALTIDAAEILGVSRQLGSIESGKIANLVVTNGDLFDSKTRIRYVFVDGNRFEFKEAPSTKSSTPATVNVTGRWNLDISTPQGPQTVVLDISQQEGQVTGTLTHPMFGTTEVESGLVSGNKMSFSATILVQGATVETSFTATVEGDSMDGTVSIQGQGTVPFQGVRPKGGTQR